MAKLQDTLDKMFGQLNIAQTQLPEYFETGLNPSKRLRPYQEECMKYFLTYMNPDKNFYGKQRSPHLLFHMATGSGKTMMMALAMLYLYERGYRNFYNPQNEMLPFHKTKCSETQNEMSSL